MVIHSLWISSEIKLPVGKKRCGTKPLCHFEWSPEISCRNSFLSARDTVVPCRIGNYMGRGSCRCEAPMLSSRIGNHTQIVSYWNETQWSYAGQETICKKFPIGKKHCGITPDRKLYATSFLSVRNAVEPRRTGNFLQPVSCPYETHCPMPNRKFPKIILTKPLI